MLKQMTLSRKIAYILESLISVVGIVLLVLTICGLRQDYIPKGSQYSSALVALALGVAVFAIERIFKYEFPLVLHAIVYSYVLLSVVIGSGVGVFRMVNWYDKILHGLLGYVLCILAMHIAIKCKIWDKSFAGNIWIMFAISMAYASIWEIFEYLCDQFLGQDMQQGASLTDTMLDMISHFGVTILFLIHYIIDAKTKLNLGMSFMAKNLATGGSLRNKNKEIAIPQDVVIGDASIANADSNECNANENIEEKN